MVAAVVVALGDAEDSAELVGHGLEHDGFLDEAVHAGVDAALPEGLLRAGGEGDDERGPAAAAELVDAGGEVEAVHVAEEDVEEDEVEGRAGGGATEEVQALEPGGDGGDAAAELLQQLLGHRPVDVVAVREQDPQAFEEGPRRRPEEGGAAVVGALPRSPVPETKKQYRTVRKPLPIRHDPDVPLHHLQNTDPSIRRRRRGLKP